MKYKFKLLNSSLPALFFMLIFFWFLCQFYLNDNEAIGTKIYICIPLYLKYFCFFIAISIFVIWLKKRKIYLMIAILSLTILSDNNIYYDWGKEVVYQRYGFFFTTPIPVKEGFVCGKKNILILQINDIKKSPIQNSRKFIFLGIWPLILPDAPIAVFSADCP